MAPGTRARATAGVDSTARTSSTPMASGARPRSRDLDRGRRRRDRARVRLDVAALGARSRDRPANALLDFSTRDRRLAAFPHARPGRALRLGEQVDAVEGPTRRRGDHARERQADPAEPPLRRRPRGPPTRSTSTPPGSRPTSAADRRGRPLPDRRAAHLCRRRRDRLPEPGRHVDGAGPPGRAAMPSACRGRLDARPSPVSASTRSRRSLSWARTEQELTAPRPLRDRRRPLPRAPAAQMVGDPLPAAEAAVRAERRQLLGVHVFGTARPSWSTSARR